MALGMAGERLGAYQLGLLLYELLASGYLWDENRRQLAYKPFVVVERSGRGYVIGFTQDPTVRAYLDGLNVLFMNAIFRGAARARPVR